MSEQSGAVSAGPRRSAGILLFRRVDESPDGVQVLLAHTGGPLWARRDLNAWSIPKGEFNDDETPLDAARREFREELGLPLPAGELHPLGEIIQKNRKVVTAWALEGALDPAAITPGTFELEWPPRSGRVLQVPEIDRVEWFAVSDARPRMFSGQAELLDRLLALIDAMATSGED
ncbi:predicted NUDIX family NTP pyrophosphohydrolase [Jatrophihabitans sp. GAS493]|uniref:NUDIX domain-containing protein n=1 Tax=Jatrophihabitans sp. GAS493 TaxID=1907575 RepID=UPI000BB9756C|nr:NUDIX domain-containing protein [Jatrophihabitans sp. GAS493]SOD73949.1 predicted NUDIX family NTP pyrophosphohydrolase [Jatrophihabitans sp. GAS493]